VAFSTYLDILRVRAARNALILGLFIRIPMWAGSVILTLHVVSTLGHNYTQAGVVVTASTIAAAVSGPWRGRLLDRHGLRKTVLPSLIVLAVCWSIAPWVGYAVLLPVVFVAGLFVVPTFSIIRQVMINAVDDERRKTALVMDSVAVELSFMIGPALGVLAATYWSTSISILVFELLSVVGGLVLWVINPQLKHADVVAEEATGDKISIRAWISPLVITILAATAVATVVLTGTDVGVVAALRDMGHQSSIGWVLAIWGAGSAVGGLIYGAVKRSLSAFSLLGLLGLTTIPVALSPSPVMIAVLLFVSGMFCAPTITATIDHLSRVVPARVRGEAMGWHGSALTVGTALGAPVVGLAIDHGSWRAGFVLAGAIGVVLAAVGLGLMTWHQRRAVDDPETPVPVSSTAAARSPDG